MAGISTTYPNVDTLREIFQREEREAAQPSTLNIALFKRIRDKIVENPKAFNMRWYMEPANVNGGYKGCIAGWAVVLSGEYTPEEVSGYGEVDPFIYAMNKLGLKGEQAMRLFYREGWPMKYRALSVLSQALAARLYLGHIIRTGSTA